MPGCLLLSYFVTPSQPHANICGQKWPVEFHCMTYSNILQSDLKKWHTHETTYEYPNLWLYLFHHWWLHLKSSSLRGWSTFGNICIHLINRFQIVLFIRENIIRLCPVDRACHPDNHNRKMLVLRLLSNKLSIFSCYQNFKEQPILMFLVKGAASEGASGSTHLYFVQVIRFVPLRKSLNPLRWIFCIIFVGRS